MPRKYKKRKPTYTDKQLIKIIQDKAKELNKIPQRRDFNCWNSIKSHFGTFNNGLIKAGFTPKTIRNFNKEDILDIIKKWSKKLGKTPSVSEWNELKKNGEYVPDVRAICRKFNMSWNNVLQLAELDINLKSRINIYSNYTEEQLLLMLKNELNRLNTNKWVIYDSNRDKSLPSVSYYKSKFKCNWNDLLKKIGYEDDKINNIQRSKEELLQILKELSKKVGHTPSIPELAKLGYNEGVYKDNFGSYNIAVKLTGLEPNTEPTEVKESNEELLKMYTNFSKKIGRPASCRDLNKSEDIYNADVFTIRFNGIVNLKKLAGFQVKEIPKRKYTKQQLIQMLLNEYNKIGRKLTNSEMKKIKNFPSLTTIARYFQTTKMSVVWEEVLKNVK